MIDGGPYSEPDNRYWRRRANRRVRKARITRSALTWSAIIAIDLIIGAVLLLAGVRAFEKITTTPSLAVEHIEVAGIERASADAIRARLERFRGSNLLALNLHGVIATCERDRWVRSAAAKRILPHTLRVTIVERTPGALVAIDDVAYLTDTTGYAIRPAIRGRDDGLPVLTGLGGLDDRPGLRDGLRRGVEAVERLRRVSQDWADGLLRLDFAQADRIVVTTRDPGPRLLLDPQDVDRNVRDYLDLRRDIDRRVGPADYVDLRWKERITVMPVVADASLGNR